MLKLGKLENLQSLTTSEATTLNPTSVVLNSPQKQKYETAQKQMSDVANDPLLMKALFQLITEMQTENRVKQSKNTFDIPSEGDQQDEELLFSGIVSQFFQSVGLYPKSTVEKKSHVTTIPKAQHMLSGDRFPYSVVGVFDETGKDHFFVLSSVVLGKGAFGRTKLAAHVVINNHVCELNLKLQAIKIQPEKIAALTELNKPCKEQMFIARVMTSHGLSRRALSTEEKINTKLYFDMEYVAGVTLEEFLKQVESHKYTLTIDQQFEIMIDLLFQLKNLHEKKIVHKDFKPANIMIDPDTLKLKVIDFGLSKDIQDNTVYTNGSPAIFPPELLTMNRFGKVITGLLDTEKGDIFAAGAALAGILGASEKSIYKKKEAASRIDPKNEAYTYFVIANAKYDFTQILPALDRKYPYNQWLYEQLVSFLNCFDAPHDIRPALQDAINRLQTIRHEYHDRQTKHLCEFQNVRSNSPLLFSNQEVFQLNSVKTKTVNEALGCSGENQFNFSGYAELPLYNDSSDASSSSGTRDEVQPEDDTSKSMIR